MTYGEVNTIEVQDPPVRLQRALAPGLKLLGQGLIETAHTAGTWSHAYECLSHIAHFLRTDSCHKHLGEPFGYLWFVALIAVKSLCVELPFSISGDLKIFDGPR